MSNHIVHFTFLQCYVSYISIQLEKEFVTHKAFMIPIFGVLLEVLKLNELLSIR